MKTQKQILKELIQEVLSSYANSKDGQVKISEKEIDTLADNYIKKVTKSFFKFPYYVNADWYIEDKIIWDLTVDTVQNEAESLLGRELSDVELHRFYSDFTDNGDIVWRRMETIAEAITNVVENPEFWSEIDSDYLEEEEKKKSLFSDSNK